MKVDFLQSAVAVERRIQHIELAQVPPGADRERLERVARLPHDTPDLSGECQALESVDDVQEIGVTKRIVERAAQLRTEFHLESLDALHLATALEYEVPVLHTFDGAGKRGGGLLRLANEASLKDRIAIRKPAAPQLALFDATGGPQYPEAQPETAKEQAKPHRTTKKR